MNGIVSGVFTLFLAFIFLAIVVWAYSRRNQSNFEKMARLPLEEDQLLNEETDTLRNK